jgi:molecular chaperone GrpE
MMPRNAAIRAVLRTATTTTTSRRVIAPSSLNVNNTIIRVTSVVANETRFSSNSRWFSSATAGKDEEADAKKEKAEPAAEEKTTTVEETSSSDTSNGDDGPSFEEQIATLEGEVKIFKDQLLRSLAEQENTRQIAKRDVTAAKNFAIKSFGKSLLDVSDNLHRALDAVPAEALEGDTNNNLKTLYEGVKMTNDGLTKAFQSNGIQSFCREPGDVFDPNKHEALMEYPDPSKEPGTVGQVIKVGFTLNNRVLRPAEVGIIKKP